MIPLQFIIALGMIWIWLHLWEHQNLNKPRRVKLLHCSHEDEPVNVLGLVSVALLCLFLTGAAVRLTILLVTGV